MDQSCEMEGVSNNETNTAEVPLCSPPGKPGTESDTPISPKCDSAVNESNDIVAEDEEEIPTKTEENNEDKDLVPENIKLDEIEVDKKEESPVDSSFEEKSEKWKLKVDIYSSTSSSCHEDSELEEQKESLITQNDERSSESMEICREFPESEDPDKSDGESDFLGFETEPDPSSITAIYQKLIAKSEAAVDIDKWSSCSGSGSPPYSDYNSDDGDHFNQSPRSRERYDTFSERDDDEAVGSTRSNYESMEYGESGSSSNVVGDTFKISPSSKRSDGYSSNPSRGKRQTVDANNPALKIPFTLGWKREVVLRSTVDGGANNKRLADIYYYTPTGKKMRSSREIMEYLEETRSPLTIENFTFLKDCINPEDPNLEIIREAKKIAIKEDGARSRKSRSKSSTPTMGSPIPEWSSGSTSPMKGRTTPLHSASYHIRGGTRRKIFISQGVSSSDTGMYSPPWTNLTANGSPRYESESMHFTGPPKKDSNMIMPCSLRCPGLHGMVPTLQCQVCVCLYHLECVGGVPLNMDASSYICKNCERESKENQMEGSAQSSKHTAPPPLVPIDKLGKSSPTHGYPPPAPPRLQRFPQHQRECQQDMRNHSSQAGGGNAYARHRPPMFIRGVVGNSGTARGGFHFSDSLTRETSLGQSLAVMQGRKYVIVPKNILSTLPGAANAAAAAAAAFSGGTLSRGSIIPISREWLSSHPVSKSSTVKVSGGTFIPPTLIQPTSSQSLAGGGNTDSRTGFVQRVQDMKPQYVIVSSPVQTGVAGSNRGALFASSVSSLPKSGQLVEKDFTKKTKAELEASRKRKLAAFALEPAAKRSKSSQSNGLTPSDLRNRELLEDMSCQDDTSDDVVADKRESMLEERKSNFAQNFMNNLSSGYSALLHVFHYLNVQDLLRAAMVCRMWRDLAGGHHSLWRTVRMKNSQVVDWVGFAETLARNRTEILDLRKMLLPTSLASSSGSAGAEDGSTSSSKNKDRRNQWGPEFCQAIGKASVSLRRLELCRCGMDVLEGVASACPNLTALCALAIRSHDLNLEFVGKMTKLQELRLKSASGMNLSSDLLELSKLTSLKHLSLTTVRHLVGDDGEKLSALSSLVNLESLELGECSAFGEAACNALGSLVCLVRLRLEKGQVGERLGNMIAKSEQESEPKGLLVALAKLPLLAQLELVNFDIGPGFDQGLAKCTSLKRLLIIPTYVAQSATSNHLVMSGAMKLSGSLHNFTWGVTHEVLQAIELFVASDSASKADNSSSGEEQEEGKKINRGKSLPSSECLPILKPLPSASSDVEETVKEELDSEGDKFSRVEFVPLPKLHGLLSAAMPSTKVQIVKMPFSATWRQGMSEVDL